MEKSKNDVFFVSPEKTRSNRKPYLTATEVIDGVKCIITLEKDREGVYREVKLSPAQTMTAGIMV